MSLLFGLLITGLSAIAAIPAICGSSPITTPKKNEDAVTDENADNLEEEKEEEACFTAIESEGISTEETNLPLEAVEIGGSENIESESFPDVAFKKSNTADTSCWGGSTPVKIAYNRNNLPPPRAEPEQKSKPKTKKEESFFDKLIKVFRYIVTPVLGFIGLLFGAKGVKRLMNA